MDLLGQVNFFSKKVKTEVQFFSIWEIVWLYEKKELIINPNFQRLFRWDKQQKTDFIESLLLWIPTPSIFVSERLDWKWELIDWLQRISTILEFMWLLLENSLPLQQVNYIKTWLLNAHYLTSLDWVTWAKLDESLKIKIKRTRININVITKDSDESTKYEVFNRLNTWWSILTNQEVRNTLLLQFWRNFYDFLMELKDDDNFQNVITLSDKDIEREFDTELILRFFSVKNYDYNIDWKIKNVSTFLSSKMNKFINNFEYDLEKEIFKKTFLILNEILASQSFKRYYDDTKKFYWRIIMPWFDAIASGIWFNLNNKDISNINKDELKLKITDLWKNSDFNENIAPWKSTEYKLSFCEKFWKDYFNSI